MLSYQNKTDVYITKNMRDRGGTLQCNIHMYCWWHKKNICLQSEQKYFIVFWRKDVWFDNECMWRRIIIFDWKCTYFDCFENRCRNSCLWWLLENYEYDMYFYFFNITFFVIKCIFLLLGSFLSCKDQIWNIAMYFYEFGHLIRNPNVYQSSETTCIHSFYHFYCIIITNIQDRHECDKLSRFLAQEGHIKLYT